MSIRTGICVHCGRAREVRGWPVDLKCQPGFKDSGLARLHENSEELFEAIQKVLSSPSSGPQFTPNGVKYFDQMILMEHYEELISIIQKITTK